MHFKMTEKQKKQRIFELTEYLIEMKAKRQFLTDKTIEYQNRINVINGTILYLEDEIEKAKIPK